jgi:formylmethanofuran dehydrogenase subunit B
MLATCLGCGCACDDIQLRVERDRIVEAVNACALGVRWFGDGAVPARVLVAGQARPTEEALSRAATILARSSRALVYLAPDISCEAQRAAIAIADALRGTIDSVTSATAMPTILAAQEAGRASATLGELRHRADVVVFWGVDPSHRYPRFWSRYAPGPSGRHVDGRSARKVIAVDVGRARGPDEADLRFTVMPDREVGTLTEFTALLSGRVDRGGVSLAGTAGRTRFAQGSDEGSALQTMLSGKYVAVIVDAEPDEHAGVRDSGRAAALIAFTQALNGPTRSALVALRAGGNRSGADACLTAQTGYPAAVDFARGYPRYRPYDSAVPRLARGDIDAVLIVGSAAGLPAGVAASMSHAPVVSIGPSASEGPFRTAEVAIDTAVAGIHESGIALRMDDVPLPLTAAAAGPPPTVEIVAALSARLLSAPVARTARMGDSSPAQ